MGGFFFLALGYISYLSLIVCGPNLRFRDSLTDLLSCYLRSLSHAILQYALDIPLVFESFSSCMYHVCIIPPCRCSMLLYSARSILNIYVVRSLNLILLMPRLFLRNYVLHDVYSITTRESRYTTSACASRFLKHKSKQHNYCREASKSRLKCSRGRHWTHGSKQDELSAKQRDRVETVLLHLKRSDSSRL
jgi:hypothetical protein